MELDIYIPSLKTGVEYDGMFWHDKKIETTCVGKKKSIRFVRIIKYVCCE